MDVREPTTNALENPAPAAEAEDLDCRRVTARGGAGEKRLYVETYGCQMNERDTDALVSLMAASGYAVTDVPEEADLICVNTCSVREKAEHKTYSELGRYRKAKEERPGTRIVMLGCVAQQAGEDAVRRMPFVDLVVGTHNLYALPEMLRERERGGVPVVRAGFHSEEEKIFRPAEVAASGRVSAFVNIMVGCDHQCTYCIVPTTRGAEISRKPDDVLREVAELAAQGIGEVTLLGQNVNSWGKQWRGSGPDFGELIFEAAKVPGVKRIRFTSPHPVNVGESLYRAYAACEALQPHIHLPLQSGSDAVLRRMKREYNRAAYLEVVRRLRAARPDISITTDFIVGFPGESEADFLQTLEIVEEVQFEGCFSFIYSRRPGTAALRLKEEVAPEVARERLYRLQSLQQRISTRIGAAYEGRVLEVLVEGRSKRRAHEVCGRTGTNRTVNFLGPPELVGEVVNVRITQGGANSLRGERVAGPEEGF